MNEERKKYGYPDPLAPAEEKDSKDYGLAYAKYISDHWFNGGFITGDCSYRERREWIRNKRLYARGKQDEKRYKDHIARETEDLSFLNLDWRPTNWMGKFVRVITGGINENNYTINVSALDRLAGSERENMKKRMNENLRAKNLLKDAKNMLGIDVTPKGPVPEDDEELRMMMDIKHRPKCEISEEILINYVFKTNNWHNTKEKVDRDLTEAGLGIVKVKTDKRNGITPTYVDPEFFIHSYVREKDFSDMKYCGHIEPTTLGNLMRNSGFDETTIRQIAKKYSKGEVGSSYISNYDEAPLDALLEAKVDVLHFTFETSKRKVYKERKTKHGEVYIEKDESYNPPENRSDYRRVDLPYNTWYEGSYVIGTDCIYDYHEVENMLTDEMDNALPDYIVRASEIYENKLGSFVDDVEATLDEMHYTSLKLQHIIAEIRPNGANIDFDMLAELEGKGKGGKMSWQEVLSLFQTKGITFSSRANLGEDGIKDGSAVQATANGIPANLPHLLEVLQKQYQDLRDITGINPFRDGTQDQRALVGVQQLAFLQSNVATSHIVNASLDITKATAERISNRIAEIYKSSQLKELYTRAVGQENMDVVDAMKNRSMHEYGFHIQLKPTEQQIQKLTEDLGIALQEGTISVEDKMEVEDLANINIKEAKEYLKYIRQKRAKERREEEMLVAQNKSQNDIASAQATAQSKVQAEEVLSQIRLNEYREKVKIDVMHQQQSNNVDAPIREEETRRELQKEYLRGQVAMNKTKFVEDEKLRRQNKNNTDHSKMIDQRTKDSQPIDFEKENLTFREMIESLS